MGTDTALLSLLGELYAQILALQARVAELEAEKKE